MTRNEAKQAAEVLKAYADGKKIEASNKGENDWFIPIISLHTADMDFDFIEFDYRIAKEPQFRPFENAEECWSEMLKHQPFGWVKVKRDGRRIALIYITDGHSFADMFDKMTFADGEPFGIKVE